MAKMKDFDTKESRMTEGVETVKETTAGEQEMLWGFPTGEYDEPTGAEMMRGEV